MNVNAINNLHPLQSATTSLSRMKAMTPRQKQLKQTADEVVGTAFFGEIFKTMRNSKLKGAFGHGGRGEEIFSAQLHEVLAKRMSHNSNFGINQALYKRFADKV